MAGAPEKPLDLTDSRLNSFTIEVKVKYRGKTIPLLAPPSFTVRNIKEVLHTLTNILVRGQKLIFKGKILDDTMTLEQSQITDGSKIMLIAPQGLHQGGDGSITKSVVTNSERPTSCTCVTQPWASSSNASTQLERWKATGVIALSESHLEAVPEEIWDCESHVRVLDVSRNYIKEIPSKVSLLKSMTKLCLNANDLTSETISWEGLSSLSFLTDLSLNRNRLDTLPSTVGALTSLRNLDISYNKLTYLPDEIGSLIQLQIFHVDNNRLTSITSSIGNCTSLVEVNFSYNHLKDLPDTLGELHTLKALYIRNNGISTLPASLFKKCRRLLSLDLHSTEITNDTLRQLEGFDDFDERRLLKLQKQLCYNVSSFEFGEGADETEHY